jgi:thymidylate synthase
MKQYLELMDNVIQKGVQKGDRTGTGSKSIFGTQMRFNLTDGFPLMTTKKLHWHSIVHELLWFLKGDTNIQYLKDHKVKIWDAWATKEGELGNMYGKQWTSWQCPNGETINQIEQVVNHIKSMPNSRRLIVSAWNPADLPNENKTPQENVMDGKMALAACHALFQFYVKPLNTHERIAYCEFLNGKQTWDNAYRKMKIENGLSVWHESYPEEYKIKWLTAAEKTLDSLNIPSHSLSCLLYQRSADLFLGLPFNIASYALLVHMIAQQCDLAVGEFIWTGGDTHLYNNTIEQAHIQLARQPGDLPRLSFNRKPKSIFDYTIDDILLSDYTAQEHIKAQVAV